MKPINELARHGLSSIGKITNKYSWFVPVMALGIVSFFVTPEQISFDGHLYLSSAKSIFSDDFSAYYHLMREPLYPVLIKVIMSIGNLRLLFFCQTMLLILSTFYISNIFAKMHSLSKGQLTVASIAGFLTIRGYGSTVLQTSLIIFLFALFISVLKKFHDSKHPSLVIKLGIIIGLMLNLFIVLGFMMFLALIVVMFEKKQVQRILIILIIAVICITPWLLYKKTAQIEKQKFISTNVTGFLISQNSDLGENRLHNLIQSGLATLGLAPELNTQPMPTNFEAGIYGMPLTKLIDNCTKIDLGYEPIVDFVTGWKSDTRCLSELAIKTSNALSISARLIYALPNLFLLIFLALGLLRYYKQYRFLIFPSIALIAPYIGVGYGISRFGAPLYLIAPFAFLTIWNGKPKKNCTKKELKLYGELG